MANTYYAPHDSLDNAILDRDPALRSYIIARRERLEKLNSSH